ncbi:shikimate kinase [Pricia sp. S334]|uniref:Shikimate kinase n=1 Tax=Pricia mediterranea TaxID=3076079 RepID=A0ABU3L842_9FLAO|nr:shikimate kinase [Pricia sp. S334]MDT7829911.1 shikimate kinase [Pricia sp. S334]
MKIILLGYMGSGKTTVGKKLARQMGLQFLDLDDYIEEKEKLSVADIFGDKGELYFRKKEHQYLNELLLRKDNFVLSVGGGTPCYGKNMETILKGSENVFYLKVPIGQLAQRLSQQKSTRPLIRHIPDGELPEFIGKHLFERSEFYNQAHTVIDCGSNEAIDIVADIMNSMQQ